MSKVKVLGRRLQIMAALVLLISAGLPWVQFPLLGNTMWLPGWVLHGGLVATLGVVVIIMSLARVRLPGLYLLLGLLAMAIMAVDANAVATRTEYVLDKLQLQVSEKTSLLSRIGLALPRLGPTDWKPQEFVGIGLWVGGLADLLLLLGAGLEASGYRSQYGLVGTLLGRPMCPGCQGRVSLKMDFCPTCGRCLVDDGTCRRCGGLCNAEWQFCAGCGETRVAPSSEAVVGVGS